MNKQLKDTPINILMLEENYDPAQPVCNNQADFSQAYKNAIKDVQNSYMEESKPWIYVYAVLWLVFFVWGLLLAMKVPDGPERTEHILFAIVFSPVYVLAHYLGKGSKAQMGCGPNRVY